MKEIAGTVSTIQPYKLIKLDYNIIIIIKLDYNIIIIKTISGFFWLYYCYCKGLDYY